ncbi:hypothetical protein [Roseibium sp.]|uniref:hypothetical protein n=1 Tax=Roseibium sp. TaxID=1936156 RepID=UPI003D1031A7
MTGPKFWGKRIDSIEDAISALEGCRKLPAESSPQARDNVNSVISFLSHSTFQRNDAAVEIVNQLTELSERLANNLKVAPELFQMALVRLRENKALFNRMNSGGYASSNGYLPPAAGSRDMQAQISSSLKHMMSGSLAGADETDALPENVDPKEAADAVNQARLAAGSKYSESVLDTFGGICDCLRVSNLLVGIVKNKFGVEGTIDTPMNGHEVFIYPKDGRLAGKKTVIMDGTAAQYTYLIGETELGVDRKLLTREDLGALDKNVRSGVFTLDEHNSFIRLVRRRLASS